MKLIKKEEYDGASNVKGEKTKTHKLKKKGLRT